MWSYFALLLRHWRACSGLARNVLTFGPSDFKCGDTSGKLPAIVRSAHSLWSLACGSPVRLTACSASSNLHDHHSDYRESPIGGKEGASVLRCFWRTLTRFWRHYASRSFYRVLSAARSTTERLRGHLGTRSQTAAPIRMPPRESGTMMPKL
jgi:hypothetical protein